MMTLLWEHTQVPEGIFQPDRNGFPETESPVKSSHITPALAEIGCVASAPENSQWLGRAVRQ